MMPPASGIWLRRDPAVTVIQDTELSELEADAVPPDGKAAGDYGYSGYDGRQKS